MKVQQLQKLLWKMCADLTILDTANLETLVSDIMETIFVKMAGVQSLVACSDIQGNVDSF